VGLWAWLLYFVEEVRPVHGWVGSGGGWSVSLAEVGAVVGVGLEGVATVGVWGYCRGYLWRRRQQ
jgi:hypothetical protein